MDNWEKLLRIDESKLNKKELLDLLNEFFFTPGNKPIEYVGTHISDYLTQLAYGQITKAQFELYIKDLKDIVEIEALKATVGRKVMLQKAVEIITKLLIKGALTILKKF